MADNRPAPTSYLAQTTPYDNYLDFPPDSTQLDMLATHFPIDKVNVFCTRLCGHLNLKVNPGTITDQAAYDSKGKAKETSLITLHEISQKAGKQLTRRIIRQALEEEKLASLSCYMESTDSSQYYDPEASKLLAQVSHTLTQPKKKAVLQSLGVSDIQADTDFCKHAGDALLAFRCDQQKQVLEEAITHVQAENTEAMDTQAASSSKSNKKLKSTMQRLLTGLDSSSLRDSSYGIHSSIARYMKTSEEDENENESHLDNLLCKEENFNKDFIDWLLTTYPDLTEEILNDALEDNDENELAFSLRKVLKIENNRLHPGELSLEDQRKLNPCFDLLTPSEISELASQLVPDDMYERAHRAKSARDMLVLAFKQSSREDREAPLTAEALAREVEDILGHEVVADNIRRTYHLPVSDTQSPTAPLTDDSPLGLDELFQVVSSLPLHKKQGQREIWEHFALSAGLEDSAINNIKADYPNDRLGRIQSMCRKICEKKPMSWNNVNTATQQLGLSAPRKPTFLPVYKSLNRPTKEQLVSELTTGHLASHWYHFALKLRISDTEVKYLQSSYRYDTGQAVKSVIEIYLKRRTASWEEVCAALRAISLNALADKLEYRYC